MNKRQFSKEMDEIIASFEGSIPSLLLHACCAPCSSACLERLAFSFEITVFYYNPNITSKDEYQKRVDEEERFINEFNNNHANASGFIPVKFIEGRYDPEKFYDISKGLESCPEGGERCFRCYALRLDESAKAAKEGNYDYFTTTLTISPLKNADKLNEIGEQLAVKHNTRFLPSDFKKKDGYKRSIELSKEYDLYRQNYCGCEFSKNNGNKI